MLTRFAADENFDNDILRALMRTINTLDIVRIQDTSLFGKNDPDVLAWCAEEARILLTHDIQTMTKYTNERIRASLPMPGVFEVDNLAPIRVVLDDLLLVIECSSDNGWNQQTCHIPLRWILYPYNGPVTTSPA